MTKAQIPVHPESPRHRWALLVGVNTYIDSNFSPLKFCVNDVRALEQVLTQLGYTVICLHDERQHEAYLPTRDNVEEELKRLCKAAQENDLLFVHFACHGKLLDQKPVLITKDTRHSLMMTRALSVPDVEQHMRDSKANQLVLSLDACHTGVEVGRDVTDPEFLHNVYDLATGFALIAASTSQQKAQEWQEKQHGVYTYYLLEGLRGRAVNPNKTVVTVRDLQEYVTDQLRRWTIREGGLIQEPTVRMEGLGDMILADYRQTPIPNLITTLSTDSSSLKITARDAEFTFTNSSEQKVAVANFRLKQSCIQDLSTFNFEVISVNAQEEVINRRTGQARYFSESLGGGVYIDMVFIPNGRFIMGSPNAIHQAENPTHEVLIHPFFLGKHQVTQAQWRAIALLPEVNFKLDPDPSYFKGESRPVESISWYEASEFCQRLSKYTSQEYRLPSEAEWEYACRAGTTTPFYFGETLTLKLANYLDSQTSKIAKRGKYIGETTSVMGFPPNSFGLYEMHGNVREWCSDHWHDSYQAAPSCGSAWVASGNPSFRVIRGGSFLSSLEDCRSANRYKDVPTNKNYRNGFRIACSFKEELIGKSR